MYSFGERLKYLIKILGYKNQEFAQLLNVSKQTVSNWCSDLNFPPKEKLDTFVSLGININWLITGKGVMVNDDNTGLELRKKLPHKEYEMEFTGLKPVEEEKSQTIVKENEVSYLSSQTRKDRLDLFMNLAFQGNQSNLRRAIETVIGKEIARQNFSALLQKETVNQELMDALYELGLNINWYLYGVGNMTAENKAGQELEKRIPGYKPLKSKNNINDATVFDFETFKQKLLGDDDFIELFNSKVAATGLNKQT